jgi:hypothetical protein
VFVQILATALTPVFHTATDGDVARARAAAIDTINADAPSDPSDLLPIAQIIAFGLAAPSSISLSTSEKISLMLRLRGNASLNRGSDQCRRALSKPPLPDVEPYPSAKLAEAGRWVERAEVALAAPSHARRNRPRTPFPPSSVRSVTRPGPTPWPKSLGSSALRPPSGGIRTAALAGAAKTTS